jgi:hypothetical protein
MKAAFYAINEKVSVKTVILKLLELSDMTDPELCDAYKNLMYINQAPKVSEQHIRTSRKQLHDLGLVQVIGVTETQSGRTARIWRKA